MNVNLYLTRDYGNLCIQTLKKQSQTKPNKANLKPICQMPKNERKLIYKKGLWKFTHIDAEKTKPNKPNFKTVSAAVTIYY